MIRSDTKNLGELGFDATVAHYLKDGGGKAGALKYIQDFHSERIKLPPSQVLPTGDGINMAEVASWRKVMVRSCHPNDIIGLVDIMPTQEATPHTLRTEVKYVRQLVETDRRIPLYHRYDLDEPYDPAKAKILIQEKVPSTQIGSIVENPHNKGIYRVEEGNKESDFVVVSHCDRDGNKIRSSDLKPVTSDGELKPVVDLYENVKEIGLIPPRWTGQVEYAQPYNQRTPFFLQTRLFREKSPKADWMIKDTYGMGSQSEESADFDTFGVTPEAGITAEIRWLMTPDLGANKFAYMEIPNRKADNNPTPPLKNMDLYIMSIMGRGMLNHGAFRHLQQASIGANFLLFKYSERFTSPCGPFS